MEDLHADIYARYTEFFKEKRGVEEGTPRHKQRETVTFRLYYGVCCVLCRCGNVDMWMVVAVTFPKYEA